MEDAKRGWITVEFAVPILQIARENPDITEQALQEYLYWRAHSVIDIACAAMQHIPFRDFFDEGKSKEDVKNEIYRFQPWRTEATAEGIQGKAEQHDAPTSTREARTHEESEADEVMEWAPSCHEEVSPVETAKPQAAQGAHGAGVACSSASEDYSSHSSDKLDMHGRPAGVQEHRLAAEAVSPSLDPGFAPAAATKGYSRCTCLIC